MGVFTLFLGSVVLHNQDNLNAETEDLNYEKISQDADRNRELLEIWKDHVKTLTKERDQAYQEIERMKMGGAMNVAPAAQFGAIESMPLPPSPGAAKRIDSLQSEVSRLQMELQKKASASGPSSSREFQMQLSALQSQVQQTKKELAEARDDKERALQEKEKAASQVERLQQEMESLKVTSQSSPEGDETSKNLQKAYNIQKKRYEDLQQRFHELERDYNSSRSQSQQPKGESSGELVALQAEIASLKNENRQLKSDLQESIASSGSAAPADRNAENFMRQARELRYENDTLKAQIEKLQVVEKELTSTRAYFMPLMKELQEKIDSMLKENTALTAEVQSARSETSQFSQKAQAINDENQKLRADLGVLREEQEQSAAQIESYRSQLQMVAADKEKLIELQNLNAGYNQELASKDAELKRLSSQIHSLEKANREIESRETDNLKSVERYQAALRANLIDMKNLKSNFEAYLESLVASFDERQR